MRPRSIVPLFAALLAPSLAFADEPQAPHERPFFARALMGFIAGSVDYHLQASVSGLTAESELDWPVTFVLTGLEAGYVGRLPGGRRWGVTLSCLGSLAGPFGEVTDRDWLTAVTTRTEFSHTDSPTGGVAVLFDVSARLEVFRDSTVARPISLDAIVGYRHEYYSLVAHGAHGWQIDSMGQMVSGTAPDIDYAHYDANKMLPYLGLGMRGSFGRLLVGAELRAMLVVSDDVDDHVYRHKIGSALSTGAGFMLTARPRYVLSRPDSRVGIAVGLDLQLRYLYAWGTLSQHLYGLDPASGSTVGAPIPDADFFTRSLLGAALATVDFSF